MVQAHRLLCQYGKAANVSKVHGASQYNLGVTDLAAARPADNNACSTNG